MAFKSTVEEEWRGKEVIIKGQKATRKSAFEIGLIVEGQAKLLCPVNWGYLAASITTQSRDKGTEPVWPNLTKLPTGANVNPGNLKIAPPISDMEVLVGTPVFYGPYVEFGTNRSESQAFLRPSLVLARGGALTIQMYNGRLQFKEFLRVA